MKTGWQSHCRRGCFRPISGRLHLAPMATKADIGAMRIALLLAALMLASCTFDQDIFGVDDPQGLAKSAVLQLDGYDQPLEREGTRLWTSRRIKRDADGRIRILYTDGREADCLIGYVTPGAGQRWNFRLTRAGCEPVR